MGRTQLKAFICLTLLFCTASYGCKSRPKERASPPTSSAAEPTAELRQQIATPTLPPPPMVEAAPRPALPPEEPKGPVTLPVEPARPALPLPATPLEPLTPPAEEIPSLPAPDLPEFEETPAPLQVEERFEPRLVTSRTDVAVLLDASGSMSAPLGQMTESKFELLRSALHEVMIEMRQQQAEFPRNISVRLFGSDSDAREQNCEDSRLVATMGEPSPDAVRQALRDAKPRGQSPISFALKSAMDDFPAGTAAERLIVLIADGADTCGENPCEAATEIERAPEKTSVNVVAFDISPEDQPNLMCIAERTDGQFFLARNEAELRSAVDQAINSTVPYNLKLSAQAGGAPLPFTMAVYRAGTDQVVRRSESLGTKLLSLPGGTYDISVEYTQSPEPRKPSKILKGVEILETTRIEQTINFDLGRLSLRALSSEGKPVPASFKISKDAGRTEIATVEAEEGAISFFLPPDTYDISADLAEPGAEPFTVIELGVELSESVSPDIAFTFQKGSLALKGVTTLGAPLPFVFNIYKAGTMELLGSGAMPSEGGSIQLAPGIFDIIVTGEDPNMAASPRTRIGGAVIRAAENTEITAIFEMGTVTLSAVDGKGNPIPAEFIVRDSETKGEIVRATTGTGAPIEVPVPPGIYEVTAYSIKSILEPKPSVTETGVIVTADQPSSRAMKFVLGTLRLRGRSAKEQPVRTQFTLYRAGTDSVSAKAPPAGDWMVFDLAPGMYDALGTDAAAGDVPDDMRPMIWIRDIKIEDGKTVSHEAIFTAGKLKVIGRGPNNRIITCRFSVFRYGTDTALIKGTTSNDWEIFEIEPGRYYVEASYMDEANNVTLKKWVNVDVDENEIVELILRF